MGNRRLPGAAIGRRLPLSSYATGPRTQGIIPVRNRTGGNARFEVILAEGSDAQVAAERYEPRPLVRNLERLLSKVTLALLCSSRTGTAELRGP